MSTCIYAIEVINFLYDDKTRTVEGDDIWNVEKRAHRTECYLTHQPYWLLHQWISIILTSRGHSAKQVVRENKQCQPGIFYRAEPHHVREQWRSIVTLHVHQDRCCKQSAVTLYMAAVIGCFVTYHSSQKSICVRLLYA